MRHSAILRVVCGILATLGVVEIAYVFVSDGRFETGFVQFAKAFAIIVFGYFAIKGSIPIAESNDSPD